LTVAATIVHITRRRPHDTNEERTAAVDFAYTPEQLELRARARSLADEIEVHELACEEQNGLPPEIHREVADAVLRHGLNAINMPAEWGGQGLSVVEQVIVQEQLGRLTNALWDMVWRPANALRACDDAQRERYLGPGIRGERRDCVAVTERDAGSDPTAIASTAERTADGGYTLNGEKWFVTVGDAADYMIVLANVMPERAPTLFLVDKDTPGVRVLRTPRYMHTFVYEHPEFAFEDVELDAGAVLGGVGQGYELTRDWFVEERLMIAARAIGAAERALRAAVDWATGREQGGGRLIGHQLIQGMVADSVVDIATNRALVHQVAWEADRGLERKMLHAKAAVVKLAASEAGGRVVDRALQMFGGRGYMRENPCERLYRDLRVDRIWEGTSEIQRLIVGNEVAKRGLDSVLSFGTGAAVAGAAA
jgi:butyryl-CoA dehydrogenase